MPGATAGDCDDNDGAGRARADARREVARRVERHRPDDGDGKAVVGGERQHAVVLEQHHPLQRGLVRDL